MREYKGWRSVLGITIDQYPSVAEVIKIMRKYTNESIMDIKTHINNKEFVISCDFCNDDEVKRIIKCINELKKSRITVKIFDNDEEIEMQFLKNWVRTCREIDIQTEAEVELEAVDIDPAELEKFKYLWEAEQDDWVVLKDNYDYAVYNIKKKGILLIEDTDLNNQVAAMMIMAGNKVIDGKKAITKLLREQD